MCNIVITKMIACKNPNMCPPNVIADYLSLFDKILLRLRTTENIFHQQNMSKCVTN